MLGNSKEIIIFAGHRGTGKSRYFTKFKVYAQATVDGATRYTVGCNSEISDWIRDQDKTLFHKHIDVTWRRPIFDLHETLYSMLVLKWS